MGSLQIFAALWILPLCLGVVVATVAVLIGLARGDAHLAAVYQASRSVRSYMVPGLGVSIKTPAEFRAWRAARDGYLATLPESERPSFDRITPPQEILTAWAQNTLGLRTVADTQVTVVDSAPREAIEAGAQEGTALDLCFRTVAGVGARYAGQRTAAPVYVASATHERSRFQVPVSITIAYCGGWNRGARS